MPVNIKQIYMKIFNLHADGGKGELYLFYPCISTFKEHFIFSWLREET
jgi:hypothetical protein